LIFETRVTKWNCLKNSTLNMRTLNSKIITLTLFVTLSTLHAGRIRDLIQPAKVEAGKSNSFLVSDLFFAETFDLKFAEHAQIEVNFNSENRMLTLKPSKNFEGFTTIGFELDGLKYDLPVWSRIKPVHIFRYRPETEPKFRLNIMGSFNSWNRDELAMTDSDGDGEYTLEHPLDPVNYLYQIVLDSTEFFDPENSQKTGNGFGGFNSVLAVSPSLGFLVGEADSQIVADDKPNRGRKHK